MIILADFLDFILERSQRINLNVLKAVSVFLLFFSHTPINSIWVLFCSCLSYFNDESAPEPNSGAHLSSENGDTSSALASALQNPNITLQEIFNLVLVHRYGTFGFRGGRTSAYYWLAVLPWLLSLTLGFVVPIILYILSWMRSRRRQQERNENYSEYKRKRRRRKILGILSDYCMVSSKQEISA
jgi:hypothetical protein